MLIIGLCGGSGSGKSTVARMLSLHNVLHVDTDAVYKEMISSSSDCTAELEKEFGEEIINHDGSVNRKKLAEIVFSDKDKHNALNRISHRHVLNKVREIISTAADNLAVCVDAPMLFESGFDKECDILVAVTAPISDRIKRIVERDNICVEDAEKRINTQLTDDKLISMVDFVINNDGNVSKLKASIDELVKLISNKLK